MIRSHSPKISVKQLNPFQSQQNGLRTTFNNNYKPSHQYPPNHIESETSESFDPSYRDSYVNETRQRRRKIFQRKILKATVIPLNFDTKNAQYFTTSYRNNPQNYVDEKHEKEAEINQENITNEKRKYQKIRNRSLQVAMMETNQPNLQTFNFQNKKHQIENKNFIATRQRDQAYSLNYRNNSNYMEQKKEKQQGSKEQLPSFAKSEYYVNQTDDKWKEHQYLIQQLSCLPQQISNIREDILNQKQQISQFNRKIASRSDENHKKQKQLLQNLIQKQQQLVRSREQLNQTLRIMGKVKVESAKRYEDLLKCQLQIQRSKRIEQLERENQKLQQQIMKNNISRATKDTYTIIDVTPLSHPVNMHSYFRDGQRDISALQTPYKPQGNFEDFEDYDNTLRDLLSPLEIKPDSDF